MKAVVLSERHSPELVEIPMPEIKEPHEVLVQIDAVSICETDAKVLDGSIRARKLPITIGHEGSGIVVDLGKSVNNIARGERVLIDPNVYDTTCRPCRSGFSNLCSNGGLMGRDVDGLFQQFKVASCRNVFLLPKTIPLEIGPLVQPFSTVVHAHSQVTIDPGDNVALLGLGVNGLMLAQVAKLRGARVIGVDIVPARLELAKSLGVDVVVNSSEVDPLPQVMSVTDGYGADLVIEAVGLPELVRKGMQMLRPRGTLLQFGISSKEAAFDMYDAYIKEVVLKTTRSSLPRDFEKAIAIVQQGTVDLRYLISKVFRFEEATEAIRFFRDRARVLRVILKT